MSAEYSPVFLVSFYILVTILLTAIFTAGLHLVIGTVTSFVRNRPEKWALAGFLFFVCLFVVMGISSPAFDESSFPEVPIAVVIFAFVLSVVGYIAGVVGLSNFEKKLGHSDQDDDDE